MAVSLTCGVDSRRVGGVLSGSCPPGSTRRRERTPPTRIDPAGQAHRHYPLAWHVHRAGRGFRHHLRDGPGLAAQYHSLPDRRHGRRRPLRGPQGRQRLALRQVLLRLGHHARRRRHDDRAPRRALARAAQGRVLRQLLPGQLPRVDAVSGPFPARPGHQGIDRTRPGHQGRPAARARLHMYIVGSLTPLAHMNKMITYTQVAFTGGERMHLLHWQTKLYFICK